MTEIVLEADSIGSIVCEPPHRMYLLSDALRKPFTAFTLRVAFTSHGIDNVILPQRL